MKLIDVSIKRPVFISMVTMFLVVLGAIALAKLPVDLYPSVTYPVLAVRANLSGAAPEEMEQLITKRLEDELSTVAGVKSMRSISREGMSMVIMEFDLGDDIRFQETQVRAKVANIRRSLPEEMSEPVVARQDPDDTPIIELTISGARSVAELSVIADEIVADRIRRIPGVGQVDLGGEAKEEVQINLNPVALSTWKLSPTAVIQAIRAYNRNDPIGKLSGNGRTWLLRSLSQARSASELGAIPVGLSSGGDTIFLRDVAEIVNGFSEVTRISRAGSAGNIGPAVDIDVVKQSGENTVEISDRVRQALDELKDVLPDDVTVTIMRDNADLVRVNVADVFETLIIGAILTVIVVLLFLRSPRSTVTTGLALPTAVISTFAIMAVFGFTINMMTLLALSLAIGLLVDDAIVVRENIFRHMSTTNASAEEASSLGTKEVILAVLATTLVIIAVFLPVGFMGGVSGQFFKQFALTVVFAILVSMWDALTMAPMLSAHYANFRDPEHEWRRFGKVGVQINHWLVRFEHWFDNLSTSYRRLLTWLLPRPWVALGVAALAMAAAVWGFMGIGKSFLPTQLGDVFSVRMSGPMAIPLAPVDDVSKIVEQRLEKIESLETWALRAGAGFSGSAYVNATIRIKPEFAKNQESLDKTRQEVRRALSEIPGYSTRISEPADPLAGGGGGRFQPVAVQISGAEMGTIRELAEQARVILEAVPGVTDVQPLDDQGLPEVRLTAISELSARYGMTPQGLGEIMRIYVEGDTSNSLKLGDDQIPIRVRLKGGQEMSPAELMTLSVATRGAGGTGNGTVDVPVGNMLKWEAGAGPTVIVRENRERIMRVGGGLERGAAVGDIVKVLNERLKEVPMPAGYNMRIVGQNEQMDELFSSITVAIGLGSLFVFMVLAALFESFLRPFTVMAAIPLAAVGAVFALQMFGKPLDLYAGIAMILLAGIVAKNSILLVDFATQRVTEQGQDPYSAIIESAPLRLRPILMTSIAMIAGMIPVATGLGVGGAVRQGLGLATIGGVVSSTLLTLLVVPSLYIAIEKVVAHFARKRKMRADQVMAAIGAGEKVLAVGEGKGPR